jgi:hypothetical protein
MKRIFSSLVVFFLTMTACTLVSSPPIPNRLPATTAPVITLTVYFTDVARYQVGAEPYERAVMRTVPATDSLPEAVLTQLFLGPTNNEKAQGVDVFLSGTTGFSKLTIENGVARVYLTGMCSSKGATYTIANLIGANLSQFPEIQWIKIYDQNGETETPDGLNGSIPFCLEP